MNVQRAYVARYDRQKDLFLAGGGKNSRAACVRSSTRVDMGTLSGGAPSRHR